MKKLFLITITLIMSTKMMAQTVTLNEAKPFLEVFLSKVEIPNMYDFHSVRKVKVDNVSAYLFRYQKNTKEALNGEHFSFVVSEKDKQILGFTNMNKKYSNPSMLSKEKTKEIATDFLKKLSGELAKSLENMWIEQHDEEITVNGKKTIISGMKYKCYRPSNADYAWVIVGFDGSVITFERNIIWDNNARQRISEKWLHDSWLKIQ